MSVSANNFVGYYQNVRGLRTKTHSFYSHVALSNYDFICITESWLTANFYDREIFDNRYIVYRCDRSAGESGAERGGGVAIAVRREYLPTQRDWPCPSPASSECIWISVPLSKHDVQGQTFLNICCVYIPHGPLYRDALETFFEICSQLKIDNPNDTFLITGDFNISDAQWVEADCAKLSLGTTNTLPLQLLSEFLSFSGLDQYNNCTNINQRILDLVFCNKNCTVISSNDLLTPEDLHHKALQIELHIVYTRPLKPAPTFVYRYYEANFNEINIKLLNINWIELFSGRALEDCVHIFYDILNDLIHKFVPKVPKRTSCSRPPWYTRPLRRLLNEKKKYHKLWKTYGNPLDLDTYKLLKKRITKLEPIFYRSYINHTESKINTHPKFFWTYIKSVFAKSGLPQVMHYKGLTASNGAQICDLFNEHFQSVFETPSDSSVDLNNLTPVINTVFDMDTIYISKNLVYKYLNSININKGSGPDDIPPVLIKNCSSSLTIPITLLFEKSIREGCVPSLWKRALVTPIPKGKVSTEIENYRPISKLCQFGKILEKMVTDQLSSAMRRHIIPNQHGFLSGRSVDSNLLSYTEFILDALDNNYQVDAVYTDFAKAFDKIDHERLLLKIWHFGIHGDLFRWIKSYVENRSQAVAVQGYTSHYRPITSGVPQGSHLGPLLFVLYINDITDCIKNSKMLLYADDTKIFRFIKNIDDCTVLQSDLNHFQAFCTSNNLFLNPDKCFIISFSRKRTSINFKYTLCNKELTRVNQIRDLGVIMDSKLTFVPHIDNILAKSFKQLGFILRVGKPFCRVSTYKILFNSYVRSRLEFASAVWNPLFKIHSDKIEKVQKKFVKAIEYRTGHKYIDYTTSLKRQNTTLLSSRRERIDVLILYKLINNIIDAPSLIHSLSFRVPRRCERTCKKKPLFHIPRSRTSYAKNGFIRRACRLYDEKFQKIDIFHETCCSFKRLSLQCIQQL
jgi:hypothetical protein